MAGIDVAKFLAHSTQAASTSAAFRKGLPVDNILQAACWSNQTTFSRFYHKSVLGTNAGNETQNAKSFAQSVPDKFVNKQR